MFNAVPSRCRVLLAVTLAALLALNMLPVVAAESPPNTAIVPVPKLDLLPDAGPSPGVRTVPAEPKKLSLWSGQAPVGDGQFEAANASITVHRPIPEKANGAAVVICPGGGYGGLLTGAEGHGIAKWLKYRIFESKGTL